MVKGISRRLTAGRTAAGFLLGGAKFSKVTKSKIHFPSKTPERSKGAEEPTSSWVFGGAGSLPCGVRGIGIKAFAL